MPYKEIEFSRQGNIATITLNRPEKANALSMAMVGEVHDALAAVGNDDSVSVAIIRANGKHFCAGHKLDEMIGLDVKAGRDLFAACTRMMKKIHEIPQPVIAQVRGVATAAGCQLVAWCDLALADETARFATPGVRIGLFCSTPMVPLTRAVGRKAAMEMLLTGRFVPAEEAARLGLVNRVVPAESLEKETLALAEQVAGASDFVLSFGKQAFYAQIDQPDDKAFSFATQSMALNLMAKDAQTGISAFLEKKTPKWENR